MLKQLKWKSLLMAAGMIGAGVLLMMFPKLSASVICGIIGTGMIVFGVINIVSYFMLDLKDTLYRNEFMIGILSMVFGAVVLLKQSLIIELVPFFLGLIIIASGMAKLQKSLVAYRIKYDKSMTYMILGLISIIVGIVVMFFMPGQTASDVLFITIGAGLVFCGASDLFVILFLANRFNTFMKEFEENGEPVIADEPAVNEPGADEIIEGEFIEKEPAEEKPAEEAPGAQE